MSCMYQPDSSILQRSNIPCNTTVINQCGENKVESFIWQNLNSGNKHKIVFISTTDRGLSRSRNLAIENAQADICLLADDDEVFYKDCADIVKNAFDENPHIDIIAFQIDNAGKVYPKRRKSIGYIGALRIASWQIAFRRQSIYRQNIRFDETLGSGASKAGGEENKFLYDSLKKGLRILFIPVSIGRMVEGESKWFHGYNKDYFLDRGKMTRKLMGRFFAFLYAGYFLSSKYGLYGKDISFWDAGKSIIKGILQ